MVNQGRTTSQLPVKMAANSVSDRLVFIYAPGDANTAQTATISISNLFSTTPNLSINAASMVVANVVIGLYAHDPANSASLTIAANTVFFTANYGYVATAPNHVKRFPLEDF